MSERMSLLSIADNKAAVLALWQAHNQVNARLSGVAHDPYFPKVQFPPQSECDSCAAGGGGGQFDTNEVFSFLLKHYSRVLTPYGKIRLVRGDKEGGGRPSAINTEELQERTRDVFEGDLTNFYLFSLFLCFSLLLVLLFVFLCKRKLRFFGGAYRTFYRE